MELIFIIYLCFIFTIIAYTLHLIRNDLKLFSDKFLLGFYLKEHPDVLKEAIIHTEPVKSEDSNEDQSHETLTDEDEYFIEKVREYEELHKDSVSFEKAKEEWQRRNIMSSS